MNNLPLATQSAATILNRMEDELTHAGSAASAQWAGIKAQAEAVPARKCEHIVITGCGDSYYAGLSMRVTLEELSGLPVAVMPSMEAATFPSRLLEDDALMLAVSVSGKVERTIEAVSRHRERGGTAIAVTAFPDNQLSSVANSVVTTGLRGTPGPVPGTANYLGSLLALIAIGLEMEARKASKRSIADSEILSALGKIDQAFRDSMAQAPSLVRPLRPPFFALGSGPDLGAASFGVAKFLEAAATVGVAQDLEEWAHEQYFATGEGTTVFICSTSPATDERALRVARSVARVGGLPVTIGIENDAPRAVNIRLPKTSTMLAPLVAWVPLTVMALAYAREHERSPFGIDRPNRMSTVDSDIYVTGGDSDGH
jgi:glucosamine 6-phosphate synthetase-like amidotransferase/phosphosugar isomerase protein